MNKIMIGVMMMLLMAASVFAAAGGNQNQNGKANHLSLFEKDPLTWEIVDGAWGHIMYKDVGDKFVFNGHQLPVGEEYTLLTYGGWTNVTCLGDNVVNSEGNIHISNVLEAPLMSNEAYIPVKIWLVPASDVNCEAGSMTAWNPTSILFEW